MINAVTLATIVSSSPAWTKRKASVQSGLAMMEYVAKRPLAITIRSNPIRRIARGDRDR